MNKYFNRILPIALICNNNDIPFEIRPCHRGYQLRFPWCDGDVAVHDFTYGVENGMVETYRFPWDEGDVSILTPTECADRIINFWKESI